MSKELQTLGFEAVGQAPASIVRSLEVASLEQLRAVYKRAEAAGVRAWMVGALCVGLALERAKRGDRAAHTLAQRFEVSRKTIERMASVFREIIRPRLMATGDRAQFPLACQAYYLTAVTAADVVHRPALALLELAEQRQDKDHRYSAARFKRDLLGEKTRPATGRLARLLRSLTRVRPADVEAFAASADAHELLDAAERRLATLRERLVEAQAAA